MSNIILIHGWRVKDRGKGSIGSLADPLRDLGHSVKMASYGYVLSPWATKMKSRIFAKLLSTGLQPRDVVIGHSNGARIAWETSFYVNELGPMIWLNPALDHQMVPGLSVPKCLVVYNKRDWATRLARLIPGSPWGDMGNVGYKPHKGLPWGRDQRMHFIEGGKGHTPYPDKPAKWATLLDAWIRGQGVDWT